MKANYQPEAEIQKTVVKFFLDLEAAAGGFFFYAVVGGSVRVSPHIGRRMKDMGARAGVSDLVFCLDAGKTVFIELKAMTGAMSPEQKKFDVIVQGLGFVSHCCKGRTGEDVICQILDILEVHGLPPAKRPLTMQTIARKWK